MTAPIFNPQFSSSDTFTPDRLIAGNLDLVTDQVTVLTGQGVLVRGSLMGERTTSAFAYTAKVGNTGGGALSAAAATGITKPGIYTAHFTGATAYTLYGPKGDVVFIAAAAGAIAAEQLGVTFTAAGAAMVAGDELYCTVSGDGKAVLSAAAAVDGSQNPTCILGDLTDTTAGDVANSPIYRAGEFNSNFMTFGVGITAAGVKAALAILGMFLKDQVTTTGAGS